MALADRMLCAIPARAGSKRLPRKNLLQLAGKPMLAYSIEAAQNSKLFSSVYVCTEDEEIAAVARRFGAEVVYLMPAELCGDLVPSHAPCRHLARSLAEKGKHHDSLLCLQPTSPLRSAEDILAGIERFAQGDVDLVASGTPIDPHYFHWAMRKKDDGYFEMYFGDKFMVERPLLPPVLRPNGSIKIANLKSLDETGNFFSKRFAVIETPEERSVHVGNRFEFDVCDFLLRKAAHARA